MNRIQHFKSGEIPPVDLHIPALEDAERALAKHQEQRPVPGTDGFTAWCEKKSLLQTQVELARSVKSAVWSQPFVDSVKAIQPRPIPPIEVFPMQPKKPTRIEELKSWQQLAERLIRLSGMPPGDEYKRVAMQAGFHRTQVVKQAKAAGIDPALVPSVPSRPDRPAQRRAQRRAKSTRRVEAPEVQLDTLLAKLSNATGECVTALDEAAFNRARRQINQLRWGIKRLVEFYEMETPILPPLPTNPWGRAVAAKTRRPTFGPNLLDLVVETEADQKKRLSTAMSAGLCPLSLPVAALLRLILGPQEFAAYQRGRELENILSDPKYREFILELTQGVA